MNNRISAFGSAISMFVCIFGEIVFSGAMKNVFTLAGNSGYICFIIASVAVVLLSPLFLRAKTGFISSAVCTVYLLVVVSRLVASMALFQSKTVIIAVLVAMTALCLLAFGVKLKGASVFTAVCFVPIILIFALCCLLGIGEYSLSNLAPVFSKGVSGITLGSLNAFSVLFPLLLPLIYIDNEYKKASVITLSFCCGGVTLSAFLGSLAFGVTSSEYQSVVAEISKNISVGKFFQRLEGPADAVYILIATAVIVLLSSMIGNGYKARSKTSLLIFGAVMLSLSALAFLSINYSVFYNLIQTLTVLLGVGVLFFVPFLFKLKRIIPACIALCLLLCSCSGAGEIENSVYVVVVACDSQNEKVTFITESGAGGDTYSVTAKSFNEAKAIVESKKKVKITFVQTGAILLDTDCKNVSEQINTVINSNMPNSAVLCFYEGKIEEVYNSFISSYASAFDFVSALKSGKKQKDKVCNSVSQINTMIKSKSSAKVSVIDKEGYKGYVTLNNSYNISGLNELQTN